MSENPPGWYRDPAEPTTQRYWDGDGWVGDRLPVDATPPDGPPAPGSAITKGISGSQPNDGSTSEAPPGWPPPGMYPPGVLPPGAYPPGALPPGAYPPGALPPGAYPPGALPPGAYPPGALPPGAYPPGVLPPGSYPPGAYPPGALPPGAYPPGALPPGAYPPGVLPPAAYAPGATPPGTLPPGTLPPGVPSPGAQQPGGMPPGFPYPYGPYLVVPVPRPHGFDLAPLGRRFSARMIDIAAVLGLNVILNGYLFYRWVQQVGPYLHAAENASKIGASAPTNGHIQTLALVIIFFAMIIWGVYEVPVTGQTGQTLGKRLMHIRVMPLEGDHQLGTARALRRFLPMGLPMLAWTCGIGFVIQFVDALSPTFNRPLRLALHDVYAATVVVAVPRSVDVPELEKSANGGTA